MFNIDPHQAPEPWIIEKIKEQKKKPQNDRPTIQIPLPEEPLPPQNDTEETEQRGVTIIDKDGTEEKM